MAGSVLSCIFSTLSLCSFCVSLYPTLCLAFSLSPLPVTCSRMLQKTTKDLSYHNVQIGCNLIILWLALPFSPLLPSLPPFDFLSFKILFHSLLHWFQTLTAHSMYFSLPSLPAINCSVLTCARPPSSCRGCVLSRWGCNWCVHQHTCTHKSTCEEGVIIYNEHVSQDAPASDGDSPCIELHHTVSQSQCVM